jgi:propionyl-CoA synthetase
MKAAKPLATEHHGQRSSSSCRCRRDVCRRCGNRTSAARKRISTNFPGFYKTSDAGYKDEDGYIFVMGRTDDIINVAGHRLSTGGMEEVLASHPDVAECAVLGIKDTLKGEVPCGFVVLKPA